MQTITQRRIHVAKIVRRNLVDVIVEPVGKQQISMTTPVARGVFCGSFFGK